MEGKVGPDLARLTVKVRTQGRSQERGHLPQGYC